MPLVSPCCLPQLEWRYIWGQFCYCCC